MKKIYLLCLILLISFSCFAQGYDIKALADTLKYGWETPEDRYQFRDDMKLRTHILDDYNSQLINIPTNLSKSALIPGLGHFQTKNYFRGQIFLSSEILLIGSAYFMFDKAQTKYDQYKSATQIDKINEYYDNALSHHKTGVIISGLALAVWLYNLYDTYLVTREYNENLWSEIKQKETNRRIIIHPNGITLKF